MYLLIDVGNTNTKFKMSSKKTIFSVPTSALNSFKLDDEFFNGEIKGCLISSVVPKVNEAIYSLIKEKYGIESVFVNQYMNTNFSYPYLKKNELGGDLVALMDGCALKSKSFIAISSGTATAILVVKNGEFVGCAIAPGFESSIKNLFDSTTLNNELDLEKEVSLLGKDTSESLRGGIINGYSFMIDGYVNSLKKKYEIEDVFITGGAKRFFKGHVSFSAKYSDDLIFDGLDSIYNAKVGGKKDE